MTPQLRVLVALEPADFARGCRTPHREAGTRARAASIKYMRKHWQKLTLFLLEPGAPLDYLVTLLRHQELAAAEPVSGQRLLSPAAVTADQSAVRAGF